MSVVSAVRRALPCMGAALGAFAGAALVAGCGADATGTQTSPVTTSSAPATTSSAPATTSTTPAATFSQIYAMAFPPMTNARCEFCHSMPPSDVGNGKLHVGMDQQTAYAALVGQTSMSARCMGRTLVVPNQPDMSLLYLKLSPNPPCGNRMPLGGTPFTDAQLEMVRSWIAAGAKND